MTDSNSRRDFLRYSTLAGLGLGIDPFSSVQIPEQVTDSKLAVEDEVAKRRTVTILQTTDVHCQIHPHDELFWENDKMVFRKTGGYAHLYTLLKELKKKNPDTFTIDTGDMFQGSQLSVETTGKALQPVLNAMGYNLYLPGNWEVVFYKDAMQKLLGGLDAPKICANMYHDLGDNKKGELIFPPYSTWSAGGIKIGFIGYTDPLVPVRQSPAYSKGIIYTKPEDNLPYYVKLLKEQEQCDFIILLSHLGLSQQIALANSEECEGVDYILGGDTHERVRRPIHCKYAKVVEPGAFGTFVGKLDLIIENGKIIDTEYSLVEVTSDKYAADKSITEIIKKIESPFIEEINRVIGYSKVPLYRYFVVENTIDTLIIDALKWKVHSDIALSNGFRFCPPRVTPDRTGNIPVTEGFLYDMLPVDSRVRTGKVTGEQLKHWMEKELSNVFAKQASKRLGGWVVKFKGMHVKFKAFNEMGERVQEISINGAPVDPNKLYSVCACERDGDPEDMLCRLPHVKDARNTSFTLHQVLRDYLREQSPVSPVLEQNAVILDAPTTILTQVTGVDYQFT